jgi:hypothetical protein
LAGVARRISAALYSVFAACSIDAAAATVYCALGQTKELVVVVLVVFVAVFLTGRRVVAGGCPKVCGADWKTGS